MLSQEEIDNLLSSLSVSADETVGPGGEATPQDDTVLERRNYKLYNFRRPDKFSKDHLRALQTIHENFSRQLGMSLTAYLRTSVEIDVVSVDQLTYDEFIRSMPSPMTICVLQMNPLPGQTLLGIGYEVTSSVIDRMLGGPGLSENKSRELTDIEQSLIRQIVNRSTVALEEAWRSMMEVTLDVVGMEESYALIQVATPGEIVALITFELTIGNRDAGLMSLCVPYPVVEQVIERLSAQRIFHGHKGEAPAGHLEKVLDRLNYAKLPVQVHLGGTAIPVSELLHLGVGDVVQLDRQVNQDLLMSVNHSPKFYCRPGTLQNNLAVYVVDDVKDPEAIEGFGLYES